ncbi:hypothetical protein Tco_0941498 [Tanacetum coccineum]|uniref:Uncharacterized protein n=1 Tax=Tanacetum coccineum TaxID=301880 RepID=A0ABQ5DRX7_9ASTR
MFAAIETQFRGNEATKKTEKTLLKQRYKNFSASSTESLDCIFNRIQKIMNKPEIETMSIDDLYNKFKIDEQSVKKSVGASSGAQNLAFMTAPSTSSTNDVNIVIHAYEFSTASPNVNTTSPQKFQTVHKDGYTLPGNLEAPRNKGSFRYQDNTKKQGNNEDTSSKAMLAIYGVDFDWSDMAEEQVQTNMALMAFSDSEVYNDKTCTKTCLKNYETLKKQLDDLIVKLNQTEFTAATYKRGLATIEEQLVTYRKNEVLFSEEVAVLKREVACKDYEINVLKNKLLGSQITDKSKKGLGYNAVHPPHPLIYNGPKKLDLSYSGLDEFKDPEFKSYGSKDSKLESNIVCDTNSDDSKENTDNSLVKEQVSEDTSSFVKSLLNVDKETIFLVDKKIEFINCNYHQRERMVSRNNYNRVDYDYYAKTTHPSAYRNMTPRAVLLKTGLTPLNTVRPVNTAHPKPAVHTLTSRYVNQKLNTAMRHYHTKRPRVVNTARSYTAPVNAVKAKKDKPQKDDTGFIDSGCSRHMTRNIAETLRFQEYCWRVMLHLGEEDHGCINFCKLQVQFLMNLHNTNEINDKGTSTQKEEISQDCIMMPIWKDASYFDSPSKDVGTDKSKIIRKQSKLSKHGHENQKSTKARSKARKFKP